MIKVKKNWLSPMLIKDTGFQTQSMLLTLIALFLSVFVFSCSAFFNEHEKLQGRKIYLEQLNKEIWTNLSFIETYQTSDKELEDKKKNDPEYEGVITSALPITPLTTTYEAGLYNGNIALLPVSTQNSLAWAYAASKRVIKYSDDLHVSDYLNNKFRYSLDIVEVRNHTQNYEDNLRDVYERGFYYEKNSTSLLEVSRYVSIVSLLSVFVILVIDIISIVHNRAVNQLSINKNKRSKRKKRPIKA